MVGSIKFSQRISPVNSQMSAKVTWSLPGKSRFASMTSFALQPKDSSGQSTQNEHLDSDLSASPNKFESKPWFVAAGILPAAIKPPPSSHSLDFLGAHDAFAVRVFQTVSLPQAIVLSSSSPRSAHLRHLSQCSRRKERQQR